MSEVGRMRGFVRQLQHQPRSESARGGAAA